MPFKQINGTNIHYEVQGIGPDTMVFCHGIFFNGSIFHDLVEYFKARYKCVIFDFRGHGKSEVTESGYDYDTLTQDVVGLIQELNLSPCHVIGHSSGAFSAMRLAYQNRELLKSLILIDTSANSETAKFKFNLINTTIRFLGTKAVVNELMKLFFGQKFLHDDNRQEEVVFWKNALMENKKTIYKSFAAFINRDSIVSNLGNIPVPTLIIVGDEDAIAIPEKSKNIKLKIPQARLASIKGAGHCSVVEEPWEVIETIEVFLNGVH